MNVLIADDSSVIRRMLKNVLEKYFIDAKYFEAADGFEALDIINNNEITFLFLDWNMPGMDGEGLVNTVRANKALNYIKIIMVTTEGTKERVVKILKKGVHGYVVKPFTADSIYKAIDKAIARMDIKVQDH